MENRSYDIRENSIQWSCTNKMMESIISDDTYDDIFTILSYNAGYVKLPEPSLIQRDNLYTYGIPSIKICTSNDNTILLLKAWLSVKQKTQISITIKPSMTINTNNISLAMMDAIPIPKKDTTTEKRIDEYFSNAIEFIMTIKLLFNEFITLVNAEN